jgi:type I restriction enzyme S subunit
MKNGWKMMRLGEICDFEGGSQPPKSQFVYYEKPGYVRFLQIRDFGSDKNITFIPESEKNRQCLGDDILIGRYGASVGKILTNKAGAYNVALMKTIPNLEVLNRSWFYNYLVSDEFQSRLLQVADRSAQAGFSKDDIYGFPVPVPPIHEQQRIVGILEKAFKGIGAAKATAEKNLQNSRTLFESHLQSVFSQRSRGWSQQPLSSLCELISGQHIDAKDYNLDKKGVGYLTGPSDFGFTNPIVTKWTEHPKRIAKRGDILVTVKGSGVGKINLLNGADVAISRQLMAVRATAADVSYLYAFLSTNFNHFQSLSKGAAIPGISREDVLDLMCPMPPPGEQQKIVKLIQAVAEETQRLTSIYRRKLAALEALKKSLLHQAFIGKL